MKFSIQIETPLSFDWQSVREIAEEAERLGFHALYFCDHLIGRTEEQAKKPNLESLTTIAALSTVTESLRLGTLVTAVSFRNPALLAKIASTIDVASQGRLQFGIGAGWYEPEYQAYGYPFPATSTRIEQLREAIQLIKKLWTEDEATFEGKHFSIRKAICDPKPIQKPHPAIWVGGTDRRILGTIAMYADGWNSIGLTYDEYSKKLETLTQECQRVGRDYTNIRRSIYTATILGRDEPELETILQQQATGYKKPEESDDEYRKRLRTDERRIVGTTSEVLEKIKAYEKLGVEEIISFFPTLPALEPTRIWAGEILPRFQAAKV